MLMAVTCQIGSVSVNVETADLHQFSESKDSVRRRMKEIVFGRTRAEGTLPCQSGVAATWETI